jgi:hypothetical protein
MNEGQEFLKYATKHVVSPAQVSLHSVEIERTKSETLKVSTDENNREYSIPSYS